MCLLSNPLFFFMVKLKSGLTGESFSLPICTPEKIMKCLVKFKADMLTILTFVSQLFYYFSTLLFCRLSFTIILNIKGSLSVNVPQSEVVLYEEIA